ncbi:MAG: hypothetical protein NDI94_05205 [Candidatus Woesearchaeota archaeon]|nr:hypothetical protein [Candidatus Woesearchaeota archaeon]
MAYATDIIKPSFEKTKALFFPIDKKYWMKLGFVNMLGGNQAASSGGGGDASGSELGELTRAKVGEFNTQALQFVTQYGQIIGVVFFVFYLLSLLMTYLNSLFTFVFIDGLLKKDFKIRKSMGELKRQAISLFYVRLIIGLISMGILFLIFYPLIDAFFKNTLASFNLWLFVPMILEIILFAMVIGVFMFFLHDFIIPIMYLKKCGINEALHHFLKVSKDRKMEIFIYFLIKILLGMASGVIVLLAIIVLIIPVILALLLLAGIGVLMFLGLKMISEILAFGITAIYIAIILMIFIYALNVIFVPLPAFFRIYSLEMVKKLEKK